MKTSNPPSFVTYRKGISPNKDKNFTKPKPEAEANLPKHPITVSGRFKIMVSQICAVGEYARFIPGIEYTVDATTKKAVEDDKKLKIATAV